MLDRLIADYLTTGTLMQVATIAPTGPRINNVWYAHAADLTQIVFTSNVNRQHSADLRTDDRVAASIIAIDLHGLGQQVRGLTLQGQATETTAEDTAAAYEMYAHRWPQVRDMFTPDQMRSHQTPMRMYTIGVERYVLWDEVNYPQDPRQVLTMTGH